MRYGIYLPPFARFGDVAFVVELAREAEHAGWDGFFLWDHVLYEEDVPFVDTWIALAAVATATESVRLGPLVTPLPRRRPWKVAREAVTLDHLSGGRLVLGVGLGIDFWREFSAFAGEADRDRTRAELLDDGIEIVTRLWSGDEVTYRGKRLAVERVRFLPTPVQRPRIPIWSAAVHPFRDGPVRRAARCDGIMPFNPAGPVTPAHVRELRARIAEQRGDAELDICLHGPRRDIEEYEAAGVTWFCESLWGGQPADEVRAVVAAGPPRE